MAIMYYDKDCDPKALSGKTIAVIGYGCIVIWNTSLFLLT